MVSSITGRGGMAHGWKMDDKRELSSEEREKLSNASVFEIHLKKSPLFLKYMYFMHYKIQNILATVVEITD